MVIRKSEPGTPGGAPFATPAKSLGGLGANETVVALRGELRQLTGDLDAIAAGNDGSTFSKDGRARLEARIERLRSLLADFGSDEPN